MRAIALLLLWATASHAEEPLADVKAVAPGVRQELRYATERNFTKKKLYPVARCLLRREVAEALARVQRALSARGLGLEVWDCYRPLAIQRALWALVPDERYVADPAKGSRHNRAAAVDVTLVDGKGRELGMGTEFDDFSPRAHRDFAELPAEARRNRALLEAAMAKEGFVGLPTEWWHFDFAGWERWPVLDVPLAK
jgi:D-alanyl-D-alanine dipeptidase